MIAVVQRPASLIRFTPRLNALAGSVLAVALALPGLVGGCSPRALLEVDVSSSDTPFQSVKLRLTAGGTSKDFANATFTADMTYKAGLYVDASGSVDVVATTFPNASAVTPSSS